MSADRHEYRIEAAGTLFGQQILHRVVENDLDAQVFDAFDLGVHHVAGQSVFGDAVAHHAAGQLAGIVDLHLMTDPGQVVGRGEPRGAGADHQHAIAGAVARRVEGQIGRAHV